MDDKIITYVGGIGLTVLFLNEYMQNQKIKSIAMALIRKEEGFSPIPILEPNGTFSIGYGHNITAHEKEKIYGAISKDYAEMLLKNDVNRILEEIKPMIITKLNPNQYAAVVSFVYNVGLYAFKNSRLLKTINNKMSNNDIYKAFKLFNKTRDKNGLLVKSEGLDQRREDEYNLFNS